MDPVTNSLIESRANTSKPAANPMRAIVNEELTKHYDFRLDPVLQVDLTVKDLYVWVEIAKGKACRKVKSNKMIMDGVSGHFAAGTITAIIGSSGSGKTTLMNYLASRMQDSVMKSSGELYVNGTHVHSIKPIKQRTGYVLQVDILYPELTPKEHF
jgi:ABC-type multidrug transport system ATPase subunit